MRNLRLVGIFAKNCDEWITFDLACICFDLVSVTLYDTLGTEATEFIINQCELTTVFCTADKIGLLAKSKEEGKIPTLANLILMDYGKVEDISMAEKAGFKLI